MQLEIQYFLNKSLPFYGSVKSRLPDGPYPIVKSFRIHKYPGALSSGRFNLSGVMHFENFFHVVEIAIVEQT